MNALRHLHRAKWLSLEAGELWRCAFSSSAIKSLGSRRAETATRAISRRAVACGAEMLKSSASIRWPKCRRPNGEAAAAVLARPVGRGTVALSCVVVSMIMKAWRVVVWLAAWHLVGKAQPSCVKRASAISAVRGRNVKPARGAAHLHRARRLVSEALRNGGACNRKSPASWH